jgi:hypothetical protein
VEVLYTKLYRSRCVKPSDAEPKVLPECDRVDLAVIKSGIHILGSDYPLAIPSISDRIVLHSAKVLNI